jgi:hypothetical protein
MIPTIHGWCEINGKVIDLTWKTDKGKYVLGEFNDDRAYAGVIFPTEYVLTSMLKLGYAGTLIEDYARNFPIMQKKWDNGINLVLSNIRGKKSVYTNNRK